MEGGGPFRRELIDVGETLDHGDLNALNPRIGGGFLSKNHHFLSKNHHFLSKNLRFLSKNHHFILNRLKNGFIYI